MWIRHSKQPLGHGWDGALGDRVLPRGHWVSSGLLPVPAGLTVDDVDIFEINEAFASQVSFPFSMLPGPRMAKVEPKGMGCRCWGGNCN